MLGADARAALLGSSIVDAYGQAIAAATWLYAADALAVVMLRDVLVALAPPGPGGLNVHGEPMPAPAVPIADRLRLWAIAVDLAGELGLTADSRKRIGLELTPPEPTSSSSPADAGGRPTRARRRALDMGGD